jgi:hypothetical protein
VNFGPTFIVQHEHIAMAHPISEFQPYNPQTRLVNNSNNNNNNNNNNLIK